MPWRFLLPLMTAALLATVGSAASVDPSARSFAPGQVWSIRSAPLSSAKVIVVRIEPWHGTEAVHVSIIDVPVPPGIPGYSGTIAISHMPFERAALAASVDRLIGTGAAPDPEFENGYRQWKDAEGGVFTIGVPEAIEAALQTLRGAMKSGRDL